MIVSALIGVLSLIIFLILAPGMSVLIEESKIINLIFPSAFIKILGSLFFGSGIIVCICISFFVYSSFSSTPKAKQKEILKGIKLPETAGENQHGSARFITDEDEIDSYYSHYQVNPHDKIIKYLFEIGEEDNPDVKLRYNEKEREELNKLIKKPILEKGGVVVGKETTGKTEKIRYIVKDEHTICLAGTGDGKTRRVVLPSICTLGFAGESMVISDPKGEIHDYTSNFLRKLGYNIYVLDFKNPEKSMCYNPLQGVIDAIDEEDYDKAQEKAWDLVSIIVDKPGENTEKIWSNGEMAVIGACILSVLIQYKGRPKYQTLSHVYTFMARMSKPMKGISPLAVYFRQLEDWHPAKMILSIADIAPEKMQGSFFTSALVSLRLFTSKSIYSITKESEIDFEKLGKEKIVLYIILPDEKTVFYPVATMIVSQVYEKLVNLADSRGGRLQIRTNFILDEFGNFSQINDMGSKITVSRSRGIRFLLIIQAYAQLKSKYGEETAKIIKGNCNNLIFMSAGDNETREEISKKLGTYTTVQYSVNSSTKNMQYHSSGQSNSLISRNLLNADELGRITPPNMLTMVKGIPFILDAPDLSKWHFNKMLGLGDEEHNTNVRLRRFGQRKTKDLKSEIIIIDNVFYTNYEKMLKEKITKQS